MLAKDYQVRCSLDAVVEDAWVTSEGIEPLYDADDYFLNLEGHEYADFTRHLDDAGRPFVNILILSNSITCRKLLAEKCASLTSVLCATAPLDSTSEGIDALQAAMKHSPEANFDFLFLDLQQSNSEAPYVLQMVTELGFSGKIFGMINYNDQSDMFYQQGLTALLKKPLQLFELRKLFDDFLKQQGFNANAAVNMESPLTRQMGALDISSLPPPPPPLVSSFVGYLML